MIAEKQRHLRRYKIALNDFSVATSYLTVAGELKKIEALPAWKPLALEGLMLAAIVSYCRPFLDSDQGSNSESIKKVDPAFMQHMMRNEDRDLHSRLVWLRCNVGAHSAYDTQPPVDYPNPESPGSWAYTTQRTASVNSIDPQQFAQLLLRAVVNADLEITRLHNEIKALQG